MRLRKKSGAESPYLESENLTREGKITETHPWRNFDEGFSGGGLLAGTSASFGRRLDVGKGMAGLGAVFIWHDGRSPSYPGRSCGRHV